MCRIWSKCCQRAKEGQLYVPGARRWPRWTFKAPSNPTSYSFFLFLEAILSRSRWQNSPFPLLHIRYFSQWKGWILKFLRNSTILSSYTDSANLQAVVIAVSKYISHIFRCSQVYDGTELGTWIFQQQKYEPPLTSLCNSSERWPYSCTAPHTLSSQQL